MEQLSAHVCMFCGPSQSAITSTPVWPEWSRACADATAPAREEQTHDACEACSHGWMDRLDESVAPILEAQLLNGDARIWTPRDQRTLSVWAIKTAMLLEYESPHEAGRFFTDNERWLFMTMLEPPSNQMKVWAAASPGDRHYHAERVRLLRQPTGSLIGEAFVVTFARGRLAFQVATRRFFEPRPDLDEVPFPAEAAEWRDACVPLWPSSETPRHWPPSRVLDAAGLKAFGTRWNEKKFNDRLEI